MSQSKCKTYGCNGEAIAYDSNNIPRCEECLEIHYKMEEGRGYEELCENDDLPEDREVDNAKV